MPWVGKKKSTNISDKSQRNSVEEQSTRNFNWYLLFTLIFLHFLWVPEKSNLKATQFLQHFQYYFRKCSIISKLSALALWEQKYYPNLILESCPNILEIIFAISEYHWSFLLCATTVLNFHAEKRAESQRKRICSQKFQGLLSNPFGIICYGTLENKLYNSRAR